MGTRGPKKRKTMTAGAEAVEITAASPISLGKRAKAHWERLLPRLVKRHVLTEEDLATLAHHCEALAGAERAAKALEKAPLVATGRGGSDVRNPLVTVWRTYTDAALKTAKALGMTPDSRGNAKQVDRTEDDDPAAKHFAHLRTVG